MKKKIVICVAVLLFVVGSALRFAWVNTRYPAPEEIVVGLGETIVSQDVEWIVHSADFLPAEEQQKLTDTLTKYGATQFNEFDYLCYILELQVTNPTEETKRVAITNGYLQTGAWQNGIAAEVFQELNADWEGSELAPGETLNIRVPYVLFEFQFMEEQWQHVKERSFELVIQLYPEKHTIQCTQG